MPEIQHCKCGNDTYLIKREIGEDTRVWAECSQCGRPTGSLGDGLEEQREWDDE